MRLLPVIRLSLTTDNTTSPERQFGKIQQYAAFGEHDLVPITEADYDLDVSGAVSPFDRPGLGRWLREDRLGMWDGLVVAKLDRLSRSLFDFTALTHWLEAHGKVLICLDPMLDMSTKEGRAMANILMTFAEFERETIGARVRDAHTKLVRDGKYTGGMLPFGYRPVKLDKNWGYEPDPVYAPIVREMADRFLRYESMASIARWLRESGVPSPKDAIRKRNAERYPDRKAKAIVGTPWSPGVVRMILQSPTVLGMATDAQRQIVRDADGVAVYRADALISRDQYERIQARLAQNDAPVRVNTSPLLQVAFCLCGAPMHSTTTNRVSRSSDRKGEPVTYAYRYYHCNSSHLRDGKCTAKRIKADALEGAVHDALLEFAGDVELTEKKIIPGRDYSEQIARVAEQIGHLNKEIAIGTATRKDVGSAREALERANGELGRLASLEPEPARIEPVKLGKTFKQHWDSLDVVGRNEFVRSAGVYAAASRDDRPPTRFIAQLAMRGSIATVFNDDVNVVIYLGNLGELRDQARAS